MWKWLAVLGLAALAAVAVPLASPVLEVASPLAERPAFVRECSAVSGEEREGILRAQLGEGAADMLARLGAGGAGAARVRARMVCECLYQGVLGVSGPGGAVPRWAPGALGSGSVRLEPEALGTCVAFQLDTLDGAARLGGVNLEVLGRLGLIR